MMIYAFFREGRRIHLLLCGLLGSAHPVLELRTRLSTSVALLRKFSHLYRVWRSVRGMHEVSGGRASIGKKFEPRRGPMLKEGALSSVPLGFSSRGAVAIHIMT